MTSLPDDVLRLPALERARRECVERGLERIDPTLIALGLLETFPSPADRLLRATGLRRGALVRALRATLAEGPAPRDPERRPPLDPDAEAIVAQAIEMAGSEDPGFGFLAYATFGLEDCVPVQVLESFGVHLEGLRERCLEIAETEDDSDAPTEGEGGEDAEAGRAALPSDSILAQLARELVAAAREGVLEPVIGRDREIDAVLETLVRRRKNNPVLVGEPGVGKTAIVEGVARRLATGDAPPRLRAVRIFELSAADLVAGTQYRGDFEARIQKIVQETRADPNLVLFIDEIHTILSAGGPQGTGDAASLLKPHLARGTLRCIGATTTDEYRRFIEKDRALARRFQPISVAEPTSEQCVEILRGVAPRLEEHHGLRIEPSALEAAVRLTVRHLPERCLPDKALDLLDQTCARRVLESQRSSPLVVTASDVADRLRDQLGKSLGEVTLDESEKLLGIEGFLRSRVLGQDHVAQRIADRLRLTRRELDFRPERPAGVFLFLGPTGVGKTEIARALAEYFHGSANRLLRLDLTEFTEPHSVSKIVGAPPGYVGHDEEGHQLTSRIRSNPQAILLLDEIEKAHPSVLNLFLQVFDDGRLTDAQGRTVSFSEVTILLTSNLGADAFRVDESIGFASPEPLPPEEARRRAKEILEGRLPPELLNRVDEVLVFNPLPPDVIQGIARMLVGRAVERFAREGKRIQVADSAVRFLAETGYDPRYGARHLARNIERLLLQPLARETYLSDWMRVERIEVSHLGSALVFEKVLRDDGGGAFKKPLSLRQPQAEADGR